MRNEYRSWVSDNAFLARKVTVGLAYWPCVTLTDWGSAAARRIRKEDGHSAYNTPVRSMALFTFTINV